jgi:hypothetical protein
MNKSIERGPWFQRETLNKGPRKGCVVERLSEGRSVFAFVGSLLASL